MKLCILITFAIINFVVSIPLGIANIVLGAVHPGMCDFKDKMGLDVSQYLLGLGIATIITSALITILIILYAMTENNIILGFLIGMYIVVILFGIAWTVVGGIILFRGNIACIKSASAHVIYALVIWSLSILSCCFSN